MDLEKEIWDGVVEAAKEFSAIKKVVLFGSRARGDNKLRSDIDLAVFAEGLDYFDFVAFCDRLEEIETLLKFDVVRIGERTDKDLLKNIETEGVVLWETQR